jgi:uncharacterized repeat protein (TIGR01451 family)
MLIAVMILGLMMLTSTLHAYGTGAGTLITNTFCQITFSNVSGTAYTDAAVPVTNTVTNAYDMSVIASPQIKKTNTAGGTISWQLGDVTNFGNLSDTITVTVRTDSYSSGTWLPSHFKILTNGTVVASNNNLVTWTSAGLSADAVLPNLEVRLRINTGVGQDETNRFYVQVNNGAPSGGDSWPTANALPPSIDDSGNARDSQSRYFIAHVSGPVMQITKSITSGSGQVKPYDIIEYTIHFTNAGGAKAVGVQILDRLPVDTVLVTNSAENNNNLSTAATVDYYESGAWVANDQATTIANTNITMVRWILSTNDTQAGDSGDVRFRVQVR